MAQKVSDNMLLFAAFSCLAMVSTVEANMIFYDGFTIELPVLFEITPRLRPAMLAPYKENVGHPNAVPNEVSVPDRSSFQVQPNRASQYDYGHPGYSNLIQYQPKPVQYPALPPHYSRPQEVPYGPILPQKPAVYTAPTTTKTTTGIPPASQDEGDQDEYLEDVEESPESR